MKNILFNIKKFLIKYLDNIIARGCRVGMRAVNGKLIIQLEWPYTYVVYTYACTYVCRSIGHSIRYKTSGSHFRVPMASDTSFVAYTKYQSLVIGP